MGSGPEIGGRRGRIRERRAVSRGWVLEEFLPGCGQTSGFVPTIKPSFLHFHEDFFTKLVTKNGRG